MAPFYDVYQTPLLLDGGDTLFVCHGALY